MSKKVKFVPNSKGVIELFKSPEVQGWLQEVGDNIASRAESMAGVPGAKYAARSHCAARTALVNIYAENEEARTDNYDNNTLVKAKGILPIHKPKL